MNEDILKKLNYIKNNTDDKKIIEYCNEQIINFEHDKTCFIDEYNLQKQKDNLNKILGVTSTQNNINLPELTPAEQNIPNDMLQIVDNINTLYDGIHKCAIQQTEEFIKEHIKNNAPNEELIEVLKNNNNKIIRNNYTEVLELLAKKDCWKPGNN